MLCPRDLLQIPILSEKHKNRMKRPGDYRSNVLGEGVVLWG